MNTILLKKASQFRLFRQHSQFILGLGISLVCLALIAKQVDLKNLVKAISEFEALYLIGGLSALALGYCFRIARWNLMLRSAGAPIKMGTCIAPFLGSITINNILPLRMGDVIRAFVFPSAIGISKMVSTGSIVMERLLDLLTLLFCLTLGLALSNHSFMPDWLAKSLVSLVSIGGIVLISLFLFSGKLADYFGALANKKFNPSHKLSKLLKALSDLLQGFQAMSRLSVLISLFSLSLLVWICESGLFLSLLAGFQFHPSEATALIVMAIVTLSTLIPSSPGYIGPFHLAGFAAITMLGASADKAASFAVLSHLALWLPTTLAGGIAIWLTPGLFNSVMLKSVRTSKNGTI